MLICKSESELREKIESASVHCARSRTSILKSLAPDMIYYYAVKNHFNGVCTCTPLDICSAFGITGTRSRSWVNQVLNDCLNGQYDGFYYTVSKSLTTNKKVCLHCLPAYQIELIGYSHPRLGAETV